MPLDRLPPLSDDLRDWLDGGRSTGQGLTRSSGSPVGEDARLVDLGTRLEDLARLALGTPGDGANGVGVDLDPFPAMPGLLEETVWGVLLWLRQNGGGGSSTGMVCIKRTIEEDMTVDPDYTCLQRDPVVADGVEVLIEDTGELLVL